MIGDFLLFEPVLISNPHSFKSELSGSTELNIHLAAQSLVLAGKVAPNQVPEGGGPVNTRNVAGRNAPIDPNAQEGGNG